MDIRDDNSLDINITPLSEESYWVELKINDVSIKMDAIQLNKLTRFLNEYSDDNAFKRFLNV